MDRQTDRPETTNTFTSWKVGHNDVQGNTIITTSVQIL